MTENNHRPVTPGIYLRSMLFWCVFAGSTIIFAPVSLLSAPFDFFRRYRFIGNWARFNLWALEKICHLNFQVSGAENVPDRTAIAMVKHQSTWETMALQLFLPPQVWVVKRELLWTPFFGWGLKMLNPIALDRKKGRQSMDQLIEQGRQRLKNGRWVIIFPEGTRVAPGKRIRYRMGGAVLAEKSGYPVVPVAHNAGEYWPRRSFIKWPGTIRVVIGKPITSEGRKAKDILDDAENWIEGTMSEITTLPS